VIDQLSVIDQVGAAVLVVAATQLEKIFKLILERDRDLHELDAFAAKRAQTFSRSVVALPTINADLAEDVPAFWALPRVTQEVLTHLADKVLKQVFLSFELYSLNER
jgi:hypothetical protein